MRTFIEILSEGKEETVRAKVFKKNNKGKFKGYLFMEWIADRFREFEKETGIKRPLDDKGNEKFDKWLEKNYG